MVKSFMSKVEMWPQIHKQHLNFEMSADDTLRNKSGTIIPMVVQDEAMVASAKKTNPRDSGFAVMDEPNCCPMSKVDRISGTLNFDLTKAAWNTDKLRNLKIMIMPIAVSFEDLEVADELSALKIKSILELQSNTTDKITYPIFNGTKLSGSVVAMGANQDGLTTNESIEGVSFDIQQLFNALTYMTNGSKLSQCIGKITYRTMSVGVMMGAGLHQTSTIKFNINIPDKAKFMNPYTFFGILLYIPQLGIETQFGIAADTTAIDHIHIDARWQFLEKNPNFVMEANVT